MNTDRSPYEILDRCIHCGMCLPSCPTYALSGLETSSPRGRIRLMKSVAEESLPVTPAFVDEMYFCLDCQACETVCPAGVRYGALVENARHRIAEAGKDPKPVKWLKRIFLNTVLVSRRRLSFFTTLMRLYEKSGLRDFVERSRILSLFSGRLAENHALLPRFAAQPYDETVERVLTPRAVVKGRVGFLTGCIMNVALPHVHRDCVEVLRACGYEVVMPKTQECCGSLHGHNGEIERARTLARKNLRAFEEYSFDRLIVDSAGCGAFLKEYGTLLAEDEEMAGKARAFSSKVKDITEFLSAIDLPQLRPVHGTVTYHEACHLVHTQKVSLEPRKLVHSLPGIEFRELPEATWCCGSAGIYNLVRFDDSMKLLERKIDNLRKTGAGIVLTANPGCHLQLQYGIRKFGLKMEVMHPVSLVKLSMGI